MSSLSDVELAFGLWCETTGVSRTDYRSHAEIFTHLHPSHPQIESLPRSVDTLKSHLFGSLPLLELRQRSIILDPDVLPTSHTPRPDRIFFLNPSQLFERIISSSEMIGANGKIYTGLGKFVDSPQEPWESRAWLSSIRTTSGQFAHYPTTAINTCTPPATHRNTALTQNEARAGDPVFPSDFVQYSCKDSQCACHSLNDVAGILHIGQVIAVGFDHRSVREHGGSVGVKAVSIRRFSPVVELPSILQSLEPEAHEKELFMHEDDISYVLESNVQPYTKQIFLHYNFQTRSELAGTALPLDITTCKHFVRRIYSSSRHQKHPIRPLWQSSPPRGQLEIEAYGRDFLRQKFQSYSHVTSLPFFTFIDGFGLYRNMYRSLLGYYITPAGLNHIERNRRTNIFPMTLGPHGSTLTDVVEAIGPRLTEFEAGSVINIHGTSTLVFAFTFCFTGDMPQQQKNSGMLTQRANYGCRSCMVTKEQRGNVNFDLLVNGRYHHQQMAMRRHMNQMTKAAQRVRYSKSTGLDPEPLIPPLQRLAPACDLILSRPADPAHSEFNGITNLAHETIINDVLTPFAQITYVKLLRRFPFPPGWPHLQNPKRYLGSYKLTEHGRWSIIAPILFRTWLQDHHIKPWFALAARQVFEPRMKAIESKLGLERNTFTLSFMITTAFAAIARSNMQLMFNGRVSLEQRSRLADDVIQSRLYVQNLLDAAALASNMNPLSRMGTPRGRSPTTSGRRDGGSQRRGQDDLRDLDTTSRGYPRMTPFSGSVNIDSQTSLLPPTSYTPTSSHLSASEALSPERETIRASRLHEARDRPNIHVGLHYVEVANEYGLPANVNTLSGEDLHRWVASSRSTCFLIKSLISIQIAPARTSYIPRTTTTPSATSCRSSTCG